MERTKIVLVRISQKRERNLTQGAKIWEAVMVEGGND